jgi:GT2 family glycosyltransferase
MENRRPRFSIIYLNYNRIDLAKARVQEARRYLYAHKDAEIIWVDNGSVDGDHLALFNEEAEAFENVRSLRISENRGFGYGFNAAVNHSTGEVIVLISNDVEVKGDFLAAAGDAIYDFCARGFLVCHKAHLGNTGWNTFNGEVFPYAAGHFLAMARGNWDYIGGFDELYYPYDYEDIDLSTAFRRIPSIQVAPDARIKSMEMLPIVHAGGQTIGFTPERYEHTVRMRALFADKWGVLNVPERP